MWTDADRQPPLFYFLRADTLEYLNTVGEHSALDNFSSCAAWHAPPVQPMPVIMLSLYVLMS